MEGWMEGWTEGQTAGWNDRQTLFHRTLPAAARGSIYFKKNIIKKP